MDRDDCVTVYGRERSFREWELRVCNAAKGMHFALHVWWRGPTAENMHEPPPEKKIGRGKRKTLI